MVRQRGTSGREAGILSRQGELFSGGPPEGFLQTLHPAARFAGLVVLLLGVSVCSDIAVLAAVFIVSSVVALVSYLNVRSVYRVILFPVVLLALPSWLTAVWFYKLPIEAGAPFFLRTLASVTLASVALHSIGLRRVGSIFQWLRLPVEFRQMWTIMVSQVAGFSELLTDMGLARNARAVTSPGGALVRKQVGRQMGVLFSRTYQRGNELAFAMDARRIDESTSRGNSAGTAGSWRGSDYGLVVTCIAAAAGMVLL